MVALRDEVETVGLTNHQILNQHSLNIVRIIQMETRNPLTLNLVTTNFETKSKRNLSDFDPIFLHI